jgi:hypothetical protein
MGQAENEVTAYFYFFFFFQKYILCLFWSTERNIGTYRPSSIASGEYLVPRLINKKQTNKCREKKSDWIRYRGYALNVLIGW